ncbi:MAG: LacI family DNA-binding transcriptional regulator [Lachnospiraceae bacterium]|nr:LacI family DNA-binding transcriptional regulator [Lachnospiraceae bacterium]
MVSIKDVAKHAGVAISTVSKVLNHYPNVSEATKKKVNEAIAELGFVPNAVAAALSSKQSGRVALLINLSTQRQAIDEISMRYLSGAISRAVELNLDVITVFFSMIRDKTREEIIRYFQSQSIDGIIIFGMSREDTVLHELVESQIFKIVLVDAPVINASTSCVWVDQEQAQYDVVRHTIRMGSYPYKRLLYIAGKKNAYVTEGRLRGVERIAEEMELEVTVRDGEFSELAARNITLEEGEAADIIVCASDLMAIGAMRALMDMDVFHPVCGFDGITLMGYAGMQMNTAKQDFAAIAARALEEVNRLLAGGEGEEVIVGHTLERLQYLDIIC